MREKIRLEDGTSFPIVDADDEIIWRCRHGRAALSHYDRQRLATLAGTYIDLINMPLSLSRKKLSMIKRALKEPQCEE